MFTGIIEEIGVVKNITRGGKSEKITIEASEILKEVKLGDSISTNGVCLTVSTLLGKSFEADVMAETLRRSNLGELKINDKVNLERALSAKDRLGGHIVTGHIDGMGRIEEIYKEDTATWITIRPKEGLIKYIVEKGSVALDGISLTVAYVDYEIFKVSIIPHTSKETTLIRYGKVGKNINVECDILGKYVERLLGFNKNSNEDKKTSIDEKFLRENGFL